MTVVIESMLIVEDDQRLQTQLEKQLAESGLVGTIFTGSTLHEAKQLLLSSQPQVVLLDVGLPDGNGLELLITRHESAAQSKIVILSGFSDEQTILHAIQLGANGYLLKHDSSLNVQQSLLSIVQGIPPLSASVAQCIMQHVRNTTGKADQTGPQMQTPLPPRLHQTLTLLARGLTYKEIAEQMSITLHTVSSYAQEIYNKLSVSSRSEAVFRARQMNIVK